MVKNKMTNEREKEKERKKNGDAWNETNEKPI